MDVGKIQNENCCALNLSQNFADGMRHILSGERKNQQGQSGLHVAKVAEEGWFLRFGQVSFVKDFHSKLNPFYPASINHGLELTSLELGRIPRHS